MHTTPRLAIAAAIIALGLAGTAARAESNDDMSFSGMFKVDRIDRNKDKMVSRAEFLEQMGKVWDMKAKEMKVKDMKMMTPADFQQVLMYLKAGS
jgi:hypothetical protein